MERILEARLPSSGEGSLRGHLLVLTGELQLGWLKAPLGEGVRVRVGEVSDLGLPTCGLKISRSVLVCGFLPR